MARGGISKDQVRIARQTILGRGEHPSIDALRVELGNTGSKSTIHRLLKELDGDAATTARGQRPLSEELGDLVGQLALRLQQEAKVAVAEERARLSRERLDQQQQVNGAQQRIGDLQAQNQALAEQLRESREQAVQLQQQKHQAELSAARLRQAAGDLETRLRERDAQIAALEEKYDQARLTLEHTRLAASEQRQHDLRQHESQLQQLRGELGQLLQTLNQRQDELTRLSRDNERLLTEARLLRER